MFSRVENESSAVSVCSAPVIFIRMRHCLLTRATFLGAEAGRGGAIVTSLLADYNVDTLQVRCASEVINVRLAYDQRETSALESSVFTKTTQQDLNIARRLLFGSRVLSFAWLHHNHILTYFRSNMRQLSIVPIAVGVYMLQAFAAASTSEPLPARTHHTSQHGLDRHPRPPQNSAAHHVHSTSRTTAGSSPRPPVVLEFLTPNGSVVNGPAIELLYTFRTMRSRTGGRELTQQEVHDLALDGITMCFQVLSYMIITSCSPVTQAPLTIQNALPAAWHKVAGWLLYDAPTSSSAESASAALFRSGDDGRDEVIQNAGAGAGDSVSVFLSLDGHPDLPLCGESACLESSDARSTYFDQIYK